MLLGRVSGAWRESWYTKWYTAFVVCCCTSTKRILLQAELDPRFSPPFKKWDSDRNARGILAKLRLCQARLAKGLRGEDKGRVENRRSGVSLPVAHGAAFARVASVRLGLALFPVPAHRTEQARFAHSALGESVTRLPTESWSSAY